MLAKYVDLTLAVSGLVEGRVHVRTVAGTQKFEIVLQRASYSPEEPDAEFIDTGAGGRIAAATIDTSAPSVVPGLVYDDFTAPITGLARVVLVATQAPASAGSFTCTISVDLIGRPA